MTSGYEDLFNAIWLNGIIDDTKTAAKQLYNYAFDYVYEMHTLEEVNPLQRNDLEFKDMKEAIRKHSNKMARKLIPSIKRLVYEESKEWPNNSNHAHNDPEYNSIFRLLKKDIKKFAENEFIKFSRLHKECPAPNTECKRLTESEDKL